MSRAQRLSVRPSIRSAAWVALAALVAWTAAPAEAQESGMQGVQLEAAGLGTSLVGGAFPHDELGLGATAGVHYRWPSGFSLGVVGIHAQPEDLSLPSGDRRRTMRQWGTLAELRYHLAREAPVRPYVGGRAGWTRLSDEARDGVESDGVAYGLVAGAEIWAGDRFAFRLSATGGGLSVSDFFGADRTTTTASWTAEAGISVFMGSVTHDTDGDGVTDERDTCPATPDGVRVTPDGCARDSDGDGVADHVDECARTPRRADTDRRGCPTDADGDGVYDGLDRCPGTPAGARVDGGGCATDADGDGVPDGLDACAGTEAGADVDEEGCGAVEAGLDRGRLALSDVHFAFGSARLTPESRELLDRVGEALVDRPSFVVQVQGHTDSIGSESANREVSWRRARSVVDYLTSRFPGLDPDRLVAVGMGETRPVADNASAAGRAENRRVEFVVLERRGAEEGDG